MANGRRSTSTSTCTLYLAKKQAKARRIRRLENTGTVTVLALFRAWHRLGLSFGLAADKTSALKQRLTVATGQRLLAAIAWKHVCKMTITTGDTVADVRVIILTFKGAFPVVCRQYNFEPGTNVETAAKKLAEKLEDTSNLWRWQDSGRLYPPVTLGDSTAV